MIPEFKVRQVPWVVELLESREKQVYKESKVILVPKVVERPESREKQVYKEYRVKLVPKETQEFKEFREIQVYRE